MNRLTIAACRRCNTPVIRCDHLITTFCDLPALTPLDEGKAWLDNHATYEVRTFHQRSYLQRRFPSPASKTVLIHQITTNQPHDHTVLAAHTCPGPALQPTDLADWLPADRAGMYPPRKTQPATLEVPF